MKKGLFIITVLLLGGFLGLNFAQAQQNQPRVKPDPSANNVLGLTQPTSTNKSTNAMVGIPQRLIIAKIGVNAIVEEVGLDKQNRMDVPQKADNVGWYKLGVKPGEVGNAVMAGHLDRVNGSPAVFWNLKNLQMGDSFQVQDDQGRSLNFKVIDKQTYPYNDFPLEKVFGPTDKRRFNLITCQGSFDSKAKIYTQREVIYSEPQ